MKVVSAANSKGLALFDLSLLRRSEWLDLERHVPGRAGFHMLLAKSSGTDSFPDAYEMELLWINSPSLHAKLEDLLIRCGPGVDSEIFFMAARRAVWVAKKWTSGARIFLYAPGILESLCFWRLSKIFGGHCLLVFDRDWRWTLKMLRAMADNARGSEDTTGVNGNRINFLCNGEGKTKLRLGPLRPGVPSRALPQVWRAARFAKSFGICDVLRNAPGMNGKARINYLFSKFPVFSHTFCNNEILGLRDAGWDAVVPYAGPSPNSMHHNRLTSALSGR